MVKYKDDLTYEYVSSRLDYDPETGVLTWKSRGSRVAGFDARFAGKPAGTKTDGGYLRIGFKIEGKVRLLSAHRLAWLLFTGGWPVGVLDHINGDRGDNRIANLRDVTVRENSLNRRDKKQTSSEIIQCLHKVATDKLDPKSLECLERAIKLLSQV